MTESSFQLHYTLDMTLRWMMPFLVGYVLGIFGERRRNRRKESLGAP